MTLKKLNFADASRERSFFYLYLSYDLFFK